MKMDPLSNVDTSGVEKVVQAGMLELKKGTSSAWKI
jgi:hypothetical protein